ncbi:hypothetical protein TUBRATIS_19430 [Tubulinosema ratisbonensis]|uniref:Uncharacterized protein n=1 Tax=Tubulinosema ratisbonensis TaxID=291195 RepID=A0A437AKI0_9MICR|nr:hypothetical protein TUBRATIS_19430 [Tubulinosema ratisbonensis]
MKIILLALFYFVQCTIKSSDIDEEIRKHKQNVINDLEKLIKDKNLEHLLKELSEGMRLILDEFFKEPMSNNPNAIKMYELYVWGVYKMQCALKKMFLHYKKNDPNNLFYQDFKINVQLYLDNFKIAMPLNKLVYFGVHSLILLSGLGLSFIVCYLTMKK